MNGLITSKGKTEQSGCPMHITHPQTSNIAIANKNSNNGHCTFLYNNPDELRCG